MVNTLAPDQKNKQQMTDVSEMRLFAVLSAASLQIHKIYA